MGDRLDKIPFLLRLGGGVSEGLIASGFFIRWLYRLLYYFLRIDGGCFLAELIGALNLRNLRIALGLFSSLGVEILLQCFEPFIELHALTNEVGEDDSYENPAVLPFDNIPGG